MWAKFMCNTECLMSRSGYKHKNAESKFSCRDNQGAVKRVTEVTVSTSSRREVCNLRTRRLPYFAPTYRPLQVASDYLNCNETFTALEILT